MLDIAADCYRSLISKERRNGSRLTENFIDPYELVTEEENVMLEPPLLLKRKS
jgi:hypothetical protein